MSNGDKPSMKQEIIPVLFLAIIVCASVIALTFTNSVTEPMIEETKQEAIDRVLTEQFPELDKSVYDEDIGVYIILTDAGNDTFTVSGFAFITAADGYGGPIDILIGLENTSVDDSLNIDEVEIRGLTVITHTETPGLGAKITNKDFYGQFAGKNATEAQLTSEGGSIDAISGATISSKAVSNTVHKDITNIVNKMNEKMNKEGGLMAWVNSL